MITLSYLQLEKHANLSADIRLLIMRMVALAIIILINGGLNSNMALDV